MDNLEDISAPVRVSIPAEVAADLGAFKKTVGSILDKLGCQACCSGKDISFELQRDVLVQDFKGTTVSAAGASIDAATSLEAVPTTTVALSPKLAYDIDNVFAAIDRVGRITGCENCCTGRNLSFRNEVNFVVGQDLSVQDVPARFR